MLYALVDSTTTSTNARPSSFGTNEPKLAAVATPKDTSPIPKGANYATTGKGPEDAPAAPNLTYTSVQGAEPRITALKTVLRERESRALTPYNPEVWLWHLKSANLLHKYAHIPNGLRFGFMGSVPSISFTYTPSNSPSLIEHHSAFATILHREFSTGRYIGPLSKSETETLIGPFQSAPLSMVPKPGKPGRFRVVQNLPFPLHPSPTISSINSSIDSDLYPCTWGTAATICLLVWSLPPGSQAAVRDVAEAYRTIPLHPSQWPGLVVRTGLDDFAIDSSFCFGFTASAGTYGEVADAGADIFRSQGIGPISNYNNLREARASIIARNGGLLVDGGRKWYKGSVMPDGRVEEFDEDLSFPILDLSSSSPRSPEDALFTYSFEDIDRLSKLLGIPWELAKDILFSPCAPFIGFLWDLSARTISIPDKKKEKYLAAILKWEARRAHTLQEVQQLYGKLLHASLVLPAGRAYLVSLEAMLPTFRDRPHMPRTPPKTTSDDLRWWKANFTQPTISRDIPGPIEVIDPSAYSDASSGTGVAIWINGRWRAWRLLPGWKANGRDIGWAEAVGMEFLVSAILTQCAEGSCIKVFGDNRGVVEGWWKGRSRNKATNNVFKRIHERVATAQCSILTCYVPSKHNPADGPSRGVFPSLSLLLPPIQIPTALELFIANFDDPLLPSERSSSDAEVKTYSPPASRSPMHHRSTRLNDEFRRQGEELLKAAQTYLCY